MTQASYILCARTKKQGEFASDPAPSSYLKVAPGATRPRPDDRIDRATWLKEVHALAVWGKDDRDTSLDRGDILFWVHGYNNAPQDVLNRHRLLDAGMRQAGWRGVIVSFDWPSASSALNYLGDRHDAKRSAMQLTDDGIRLLSRQQRTDCRINVHLLAHSTGAFVVREAFDDADDCMLPNEAWMVSQVVFVAADVSQGSMSAHADKSRSLFRHLKRLTNYVNGADGALKISNTKRGGVAPRVGRDGLPADAPTSATDVDCTRFYLRMEADPAFRARYDLSGSGPHAAPLSSHAWHFSNRLFMQDLCSTLIGDLVQERIPTRTRDGTRLSLMPPSGE
jgi:hypothetical protein